MYLRHWALVESYRTARGPRQRIVAWLGAMDEQGRLRVKRCAERTIAQQEGLFQTTQPEWVEVDVSRVTWSAAASSAARGWGWNCCGVWNWTGF